MRSSHFFIQWFDILLLIVNVQACSLSRAGWRG